ncbi:MAG: trypsin-like peptidase domain-containing protein [Ignavibacteriales bacterium]
MAADISNLVVEILHYHSDDKNPHWSVGSGFFVGESLVLTALHNVDSRGELLVRIHGKEEHPAAVILPTDRDHKDMDLALLEVSDVAVDVLPLRYGKVDRSTPAEVERCWAIGFPKFKVLEHEHGKPKPPPTTVQIKGKIPTCECLDQQRLTLHAEINPRPSSEGSEWAGMSGAVVFAGNDIVVGVITEHHLPEGESALNVVPITAIDNLLPSTEAAKWWQLLGVNHQALVSLPDVKIGDISGELIIKSYIENYGNKFAIENPYGEALIELMNSLEEKRNEKENLKILSSYNPSALPYFDPKVKEFVTTNRLEELNNALAYLQDHRLLLFTGIGGVGKTTLARALIDIRAANTPNPFWFDFRMNQSAKLGDILEKLAAYLKSPEIAIFKEEKREPDLNDINKLTDKLNEGNPVWLIFDNLETILDDIYVKDENMDLFFTCLRNNAHEAKIIITSRIFPKLRNGEYLINIIEGDRQDIKGLKTNFAVDYLVKNGLGNLEPGKLEELATGVDGHPLALQLLIALVKKFGVSDTLKDLTRYKNLREDTIRKTRKLFDKLAGDEKELFERISVYRKAETMDAIEIMFTDKTPIDAVDNLIDKSLLETDHQGKYWLHPLVQEFSYDDLENKKEVHMIAYNFYKSLNLPEKPTKKEDLQPAIEAHYHACEAGEYDLAADIIWEFNLHNHLDLWGYPRTLIEIYEKMLPKDHFKDEPILKDKQVHGGILGSLGSAYRALGDAKKAIDYYEQALKIAREIDDIRSEGSWLGNLGLA